MLSTLVFLIACQWAGAGSSRPAKPAAVGTGLAASADRRHCPVDQDRGLPCGESLGNWGLDDGEDPEGVATDLLCTFWAPPFEGLGCPVLETTARPTSIPPPAARYILLLRFRC